MGQDDGVRVAAAEHGGEAAEQDDQHGQQQQRPEHEDADAKANGLFVHVVAPC
jgi:hypothetical protein